MGAGEIRSGIMSLAKSVRLHIWLLLTLGIALCGACSPIPSPVTKGGATLQVQTAAYPVITAPRVTDQPYPIASLLPATTDTPQPEPSATSELLYATPENEQVCKPAGIASWVSNGMGLYHDQLQLLSVGFQAVQGGVCTIRVKDFKIIVQVVDLQ